MLSQMYLNGIGVERNFLMSIEWAMRAIENNEVTFADMYHITLRNLNITTQEFNKLRLQDESNSLTVQTQAINYFISYLNFIFNVYGIDMYAGVEIYNNTMQIHIR